MLRCLAYQRGLGFRGDDEPGVCRQHRRWEVDVDREVERVSIVTVVVPLAVGAEVGEIGLDFDADEASAGPQCEDVGAAAVVEPDLVQR